MRLDHIVLWTRDPRVAMDFYTRVVGLAPVRFAEFENDEAPFPSVRVCEDSIIDLLPIDSIAATESLTKVAGSAGHPVNHVCLALSKSEYDALDRRLQAEGVDTSARLNRTYGARGLGAAGLLLRRSGRQCGRGPLLRVSVRDSRLTLATPAWPWLPASASVRYAVVRLGLIARAPRKRGTPSARWAGRIVAGLGNYRSLSRQDGGDPLRPARPGWRSPLAVAWTFPAACIGEGPGQQGR